MKEICQIQRRGFTLIELLVVISIISLLLAILMPSLSKAREQANRITCGANLKSIGLASLLYAEDNRNCLPAAYVMHWFRAVETGKLTNGNELAFHLLVRGEYIEPQSEIWRCRSDRNPIVVTEDTDYYPMYTPPFGIYSYQWNQVAGYREESGGSELPPFKLTDNDASTMPVCRDKQHRSPVYPASYMFFTGTAYVPFENHRQAGFNSVFVDGHVDWITQRNFDQYKWDFAHRPIPVP